MGTCTVYLSTFRRFFMSTYDRPPAALVGTLRIPNALKSEDYVIGRDVLAVVPCDALLDSDGEHRGGLIGCDLVSKVVFQCEIGFELYQAVVQVNGTSKVGILILEDLDLIRSVELPPPIPAISIPPRFLEWTRTG